MSPPKPKAAVPYPFVVEALEPLRPKVRPLFSGFAIDSGYRLLMILRDRPKLPRDNGVWLVLSEGTDPADPSLRKDFPSIRRIELLRAKIGHWLLIPSDDERFEELALHACELMVRHDPRFGRVPQSKQ
jgi:hypothetical protein